MPRAKRLKSHPDRDTIAAYAASQPLFTALRYAITALDTTTANLADARDIVQSLHVKIANDDQHNDPRRHEAYVFAALSAWKSTTDAFCQVFEELVNVAAPDPTEGRESGARFEEFRAMLETVQTARDQVKQAVAGDKPGSSEREVQGEVDDTSMEDVTRDAVEDAEPAQSVNGLGKRPMVDSGNDLEVQTSPAKTANSARGVRYSKAGDKILWENNKLRVPYKTLQADEKKAWNIVANRQKHNDRIKKQKQKKAHGNTQATEEPVETASAEKTIPAVNIEFEDVSAEVEARLRAKQEKKAAEKAKTAVKKRKRDSGDSFGNVVQAEAVDPLDALQQSLADKPQKPARKKPKGNGVDQADPSAVGAEHLDATLVGSAKKRKEVDHHRPSATDGIASQKKRKKARS